MFEAVTKLFQDVDQLVVVANRLGKKYAEAVGQPESYVAYGIAETEKIAIDLAGLYAADTSANIIAALRDSIDGSSYVHALEDLVSGKLTEVEAYAAKNVANATWRASQPFRDMINKPLGRITRQINTQFNLLAPAEEHKDLIQIQEGARILLEHIPTF